VAWARRLPSGRWQGQYRHAGQLHSVHGTFALKRDAKEAADKEKAEKTRDVWIDRS
jgi:hypothetical protein